MKNLLSLFFCLCGSTWASAEVIRSHFKDNLCLAVNDDATSGWRTDRNVEVESCDGDAHQQFSLVSIVLESGETIFKFQALNQCLDIDPETTEPWTQNNNVQIAPCNDSVRQQFEQISQGEGWISIRSKLDGRCLDIDLNSANGWRTGRNVHLWTCHGEPNQLWSITAQNPGPAQNP